ncbi:unnamed protein product, partial [Gongylonema pulchrum]|uniref:Radical SAM protein n=1 Tax=Gongylonema pulchrum TaxID=637853 RepID=A0A183E4B8_9BILA
EVSSDQVEKEFWKNLIDIENTVSVKYGADLLVTKVGSGFPMRDYDFGKINQRERAMYVNHPWNLNNVAVLKDSVLNYFETGISGEFTLMCCRTEKIVFQFCKAAGID